MVRKHSTAQPKTSDDDASSADQVQLVATAGDQNFHATNTPQ